MTLESFNRCSLCGEQWVGAHSCAIGPPSYGGWHPPIDGPSDLRAVVAALEARVAKLERDLLMRTPMSAAAPGAGEGSDV